MSRSALLLGFRVTLVLLGAACAMHALWLYSNFPAGGNGDASLGAARALEVSAGIALAALLCLLLTFASWRAQGIRSRHNPPLERTGDGG